MIARYFGKLTAPEVQQYLGETLKNMQHGKENGDVFPNKCNILNIRSSTPRILTMYICKLKGHALQEVSSSRYLGVDIQSNLYLMLQSWCSGSTLDFKSGHLG
ncbi:hypothetical protein ACF0H5_014720 [Mactra antiquata]